MRHAFRAVVLVLTGWPLASACTSYNGLEVTTLDAGNDGSACVSSPCGVMTAPTDGGDGGAESDASKDDDAGADASDAAPDAQIPVSHMLGLHSGADTTLVGTAGASNCGTNKPQVCAAASALRTDTNPASVALIRWVVSTCPQGATVKGATITLQVTDPRPDGDPISVFPLRRAWDPATAVWDTGWGSPGASAESDFDEAKGVSFTATTVKAVQIPLSAAVVQGWVSNPATNFGVKIVATSGGVSFASLETSSPPTLTLDCWY